MNHLCLIMLKQFDIDRLKKLETDVALLNFRFPLAVIAKRTGFDKGSISHFFSGNRPISDGFINKFYEVFSEDLRRAGREEALEDGNELDALKRVKDQLSAVTGLLLSAVNQQQPSLLPREGIESATGSSIITVLLSNITKVVENNTRVVESIAKMATTNEKLVATNEKLAAAYIESR